MPPSASTGAVLWANLHLLFWLSLVPFVTAWMGENHFAPSPSRSTASCCYVRRSPTRFSSGRSSALAGARRRRWRRPSAPDRKGRARRSWPTALAIPAALFVHPAVAGALFVGVALMWLVPDRRIERALDAEAP